MKFFKTAQHKSAFLEDDDIDARFDKMMAWIKSLARKDFNKVKKAMDKSYDAYQVLHGIEPDDEDGTGEYIPHPEEGR